MSTLPEQDVSLRCTPMASDGTSSGGAQAPVDTQYEREIAAEHVGEIISQCRIDDRYRKLPRYIYDFFDQVDALDLNHLTNKLDAVDMPLGVIQ